MGNKSIFYMLEKNIYICFELEMYKVVFFFLIFKRKLKGYEQIR